MISKLTLVNKRRNKLPKQINLRVTGKHKMHCAGCENTVEFILSQIPEVEHVAADHKTQKITVSLKSDRVELQQLQSELEYAGYQVEPSQ